MTISCNFLTVKLSISLNGWIKENGFSLLKMYFKNPFIPIKSKFSITRVTNEEDWMVTVELSPLRQTLTRILLQTIESLADSQWELRRITKQVRFQLSCNKCWKRYLPFSLEFSISLYDFAMKWMPMSCMCTCLQLHECVLI